LFYDDSESVAYVWVDHNGATFIGNKQIHKQTFNLKYQYRSLYNIEY